MAIAGTCSTFEPVFYRLTCAPRRSISLWTTQKKKPVFTQPLAHGMDESQVETEDMEIVRKPRWVTALGCLRYSDMFASGMVFLCLFCGATLIALNLGSWDGEIRIWRLDPKLKSFSFVGNIPAPGVVNSLQFVSAPRSEIATYTWAKRRDLETASSTQEGVRLRAARMTELKSVLLVAGVGQEMRLGRWVQKKGEGILNGALVVAFNPRTPSS